ncbi:MAG: RagB/SusD family nutrient uptake outer membrane protein [Candidatus Symbiothrix sp.]|jgi:hypothetical protein|nr:RagB/SusD family nutrient uptake outer membrane protein [Candidatus Symbiothrix sp.]
MKNRYKIVLLFITAALFTTSCEDFLNPEAPSKFESSYVFSSAAETKKVLLGAYALFTEDSYTSRMSNVWMQNTDVEVCAPSAAPDGSRRDVWSLQGGLLTGFGDIQTAWNHNYAAIERANQCIEGIQASAIADDPDMKTMLGEAYCLRAYRYFLLCNFWGDVPYPREATKVGGNFDMPKTDKHIIYSGMIQDLVDNEENMYFMNKYASDGFERMNRDFAVGMIARLALFRAGYGMTKEGIMKRADDYLDVAGDPALAVTYTVNGTTKTARTSKEYYQLAKDYCEKLISLQPRMLLSDFGKIFKDQCEWVKNDATEVLYEVAFGTTNSGGDVGWCVGMTVTGGSKGTTTIQTNLSPSYYYSFDRADKRRDVTVAKIRYTGDNIQSTEAITALAIGKWNRMWLKNDPGASSSKGTGINWPLMRYSDVLLMLAEAENELNGPTALAKQQLAIVRERAFGAANYAEKVDAYIANLTSKERFFDALVNERAWEFGGECMRKFDLVRWNIYGKKIVETMQTLDNLGKAGRGLELENPEVAKYANYADILYYRKNAGTIVFLNDFFKPSEVPTNTTTEDNLELPGYENYYGTLNWTKNLYKEITDAVTGERTYETADFTVRCWRGYKDPTGVSAVPYLLPISTSTILTSNVLNNDGYGHVFSAN